MAKLRVERIGGFAGFGGTGGHVRSQGEVDTEALSETERETVEKLFQSRGMANTSQTRDGFRYRITRATANGLETVEAPEEAVPAVLSRCVKDELV